MTNASILNEIITSRKSIFPKDYSAEPIEEAVLEEIVRSADYAPNHKRMRPWRLRVFRGKEKAQLGKELARLYKKNASAEDYSESKEKAIVQRVEQSDAIVTISIRFSGEVAQWEEIAATAMAVQNMYLSCTANGVGCYWGTPGFMHQLKDFLRLEDDQECYGLFFMGKVKM